MNFQGTVTHIFSLAEDRSGVALAEASFGGGTLRRARLSSLSATFVSVPTHLHVTWKTIQLSFAISPALGSSLAQKCSRGPSQPQLVFDFTAVYCSYHLCIYNVHLPIILDCESRSSSASPVLLYYLSVLLLALSRKAMRNCMIV